MTVPLVLTLVAACLGAFASVCAHAEDWPEHGFYRVEAVEHAATPRACHLRAELNVDGKIFALILTDRRSGSLLVQLLAQDAGVTAAKAVWVGFDGKSVFHFTPALRDGSPELPSVTGVMPDGRHVIEQMRLAAKGAHWLQVAALPYRQAVPAKGMEQALDDLVACRTLRELGQGGPNGWLGTTVIADRDPLTHGFPLDMTAAQN